MQLNERALRHWAVAIQQAEELRIAVHQDLSTVVDCGISVPGGLQAGRLLAEICLADLGRVDMTNGDAAVWRGPAVRTMTDHPVAACMASQYAGWPVQHDKFFAMASGPMRAARGREPLLASLAQTERPDRVIGVLESNQLPSRDICQSMADECGVTPDKMTLLVAPTRSLAGSIQVVSRSVETALHKLHELGFDLHRVVSGFGVAPLPPPAADDLAAIGRTNDAVLYGGEVTLWVRGDDESLAEIGPRIPSAASTAYGEPFLRIFEKYDRDFYKIDPLLFSPASITLVNLDTGWSLQFGETRPEILRQSFRDS